MWNIQGACRICYFKGIMILERETITAELLLTKLANQPIIFFAVWKTALKSWQISQLSSSLYERRHWVVKFNRIEYSENFDITVHTWIRAYICFSITLVKVRHLWKICYFVSHRYKKHCCFLSKCWLNRIFLRILKLNSLAWLTWNNKQHQYVVGCV